jgi:dienelactone hydrolase
MDLATARSQFQPRFKPTNFQPGGPAELPPPGVFKTVHYPSPAGQLAAYLSPDPGDGKRHPALVWAHGGFGGIGEFCWAAAPASNDQSVNAFREAGVVCLCPSWRGENDNPGQFESFYGEIDDALAAVEFLRAQPYVDPQRVYLAGHSTGGTVALLAAELDVKRHIRAVFSFGGMPNMVEMVQRDGDYGPTPFDPASVMDKVVRSPALWVRKLQTPTWYFEGALRSPYPPDAKAMEKLAQTTNAPFHAFIVDGGTHFTILRPLTKLVAAKIVADTGDATSISFTADEVSKAIAAEATTK